MKRLLTLMLVVSVMSVLGCRNETKSYVYQGKCLRFSPADHTLEPMPVT